MSTYPFYSSTAISPCPKKLCCNMIQTIQLHILFQWDQNYFLHSNILFSSIYSNTSPSTKHKLQNNLFKHTLGWIYVHIPILLLHSHFLLSKKLCHNMIQTIPVHILFQWDQNYFLHSNILSILK